ncbi:MAG: molybdopterin molybdotransferase MoeA [Thermodesulfovibrionales bacterium]
MDRIAYKEALSLTLERISPLPPELVSVEDLPGMVLAEDIFAAVDSPLQDISFKDGYAVKSEDVRGASEERPVVLRLKGALSPEHGNELMVVSGSAVKVMSGSVIPEGATAVVSREFASDDGVTVKVCNDASPGRNILKKGRDVRKGERIVCKGTKLSPMEVGLIAAAGHESAMACPLPRVTVISTGEETLAAGKVFANNLVTISAWCSRYGINNRNVVASEREKDIAEAIRQSLDLSDCIITSGSSWEDDGGLVIRILDRMGWEKLYHHVSMGPGKTVGFGLIGAKPVFCLPGGPSANQVAFLQLALPGLLALSGQKGKGLPFRRAVLGETIRGQEDWTHFVFGRLSPSGRGLLFHPLKEERRLRMMAEAEGIVCIPPGVRGLEKGTRVNVQLTSGE